MIVRLACCCGLRRKEICGLEVRDLMVGGKMPVINIRGEISKKDYKGRAYDREVPLWWDKGTLSDLTAWTRERASQGASGRDPLVPSNHGGRMEEKAPARRWKTLIRKVLGEDREIQSSIHGGRHSFCSHSQAAGRTAVEVQEAAGHANAKMTLDTYSHLLNSRRDLPDVFSGGGGGTHRENDQ